MSNDNNVKADCDLLSQTVATLLEERAHLRAKERNLRVREQALKNQYKAGMGPSTDAQGLAASLRHILPYYLYPQNVGAVDQATWNFYYTFDFDFGVNPVLTSNTRQTQQIEVSQESMFVATAISVDAADDSDASARGPYQVNFFDNQSSRQLNEKPVPAQSIGSRSNPTKLSTGFLVMPNSTLSAEVTTWIPNGQTVTTVGSGVLQLIIYGFRMRPGNFRTVLSKVS